MAENKKSFPETEEKILDYWQKNNIFHKTLQKDSPKGNFVFYEGPPTANGKPGIHHVLARAFKDVMPRFKTMQGFYVARKAGWDTHGLPVELQIEKELEISGKPQIEDYGIKKFNEKCKQSVWRYQKDWEELTKRIAFWLDLEDPYITYNNEYIETLWWITKQAWDKNLLYLGHKVVPQCPRCGTSLSSHEVALGYKEVEENSIFIKFKVKGEENTFILSWTTTPWTLPGNVALAAGKDIDYAKVEKGGEKIIVAKDLLDSALEGEYKIFEEIKGKDLVGLEYEPLFPSVVPSDTKNYQNAFKVYPADFVSTEEGTGIVHTAVMYGEDDYRLGEEVGLPKFHTVDENGNFLPTVKKWAGKFVKDKEVEQSIIQDLEEKGLLFREMMYKHDYPFCWRCDTPLLYYAKNSWFIKMTELKKKLIKNNEEINWVPDYIKHGRFGEWLENVKDWAISRQRYWGTPLPIWQCEKCHEKKVLANREELTEEQKKDLHRPYIDEVEFDCSCGGKMKRVPDVFDCWFDSGSMPFAQYHYPFENKELIDKGKQFPADYIAEAIDQTRGWFYTLLAVSTILEKGPSYKNVICLAHIRDKHGKKMSKSKGNVVDPWEVINKFGSDSLRLHLYTINQPGDSKNFDIKNVQDVLRKNLLILWNVYTFRQMYAEDNKEIKKPNSENILDIWILSKLNLSIRDITDNLEKYYVTEAARKITDFINELSTWYLRRSRERFKSNDKEDAKKALDTLSFVLLELSKLMAPFTPFFAEDLYLELTNKKLKESVHLEDWPKVDKKLIDEKVLQEMDVARKIVEAGLAARAEAGVKVRQPLQSYFTSLVKKLDDELTEIVKDELNVKELKFGKDKLDTELTDELKQEGLFRELVRQINSMRKKHGLTIQDKIKVYYHTKGDEIKKVFENFEDELKKDTLSKELIGELKDGAEDVKINGQEVNLFIEKI